MDEERLMEEEEEEAGPLVLHSEEEEEEGVHQMEELEVHIKFVVDVDVVVPFDRGLVYRAALVVDDKQRGVR